MNNEQDKPADEAPATESSEASTETAATETQPPVDNDYVEEGATKFTDEEVDLNKPQDQASS